ncbi:LysR family transcriptional regulator [Hydrogenophaga sp. BPS33]|uniref:LysR family transcriptional regulator n=1 Tax=Hydrogenophaga sp. BPS33 TaxID=2651974 RepID=UPI00135CC2D6|nr:LysR family transcriptional regulator [Hydrogenophaga sp. BPS33]
MSRTSAVTLRQLRAFNAVAEEGSVARAAQRLHLTASALSMLIGGLEAELGVRLFERTTRRMVLTDEGNKLLPAIEQVFRHLDGAITDLHEFVQQRSSRLRIAASPLLAATLLPQLMVLFRERFPAVRLTLRDLPVGAVAQAVRAGEADLGICTADVDTLDLQATVLHQDRLMLACLESHPLASRFEVRWSELVGETWVLMQPGSGLRNLAARGLAEMGEPVEAAFEVANVATAVGLVEAGLAVSALPRYALTRTRAVGIRAVPLIDPVVERDIVALNAPERPLTSAGEAFVAFFKQAAGLD